MSSSVKPAPSSERVRVLPGMSPETVVVTGYSLAGRPVTRMEIPKRWLTDEWIAWLETRCAKEDGEQPVQLKLLG